MFLAKWTDTSNQVIVVIVVALMVSIDEGTLLQTQMLLSLTAREINVTDARKGFESGQKHSCFGRNPKLLLKHTFPSLANEETIIKTSS